jgi:hypothetical protein
MKRKKYLLLFTNLIVILLITFVSGSECFVKLDINETIEKDVTFNLYNFQTIYGNFEGFNLVYNPSVGSDYILQTYESEKLINQYSIYTSTLLFLSRSNSGGGVLVSNYGIIEAYIPFNKSINKIKIINKDKISEFNLNLSDLDCIRTCKIGGETVDLDKNERCCEGFRYVSKDNNYYCQKCGDNICSVGEDNNTCSEDCNVIAKPIVSLFLDFIKRWFLGDNSISSEDVVSRVRNWVIQS